MHPQLASELQFCHPSGSAIAAEKFSFPSARTRKIPPQTDAPTGTFRCGSRVFDAKIPQIPGPKNRTADVRIFEAKGKNIIYILSVFHVALEHFSSAARLDLWRFRCCFCVVLEHVSCAARIYLLRFCSPFGVVLEHVSCAARLHLWRFCSRFRAVLELH